VSIFKRWLEMEKEEQKNKSPDLKVSYLPLNKQNVVIVYLINMFNNIKNDLFSCGHRTASVLLRASML
jgi:hypothetical protein